MPAFESVTYRNVYPGVSVILRIDGDGRPIYDLDLAPGARLDQVRIEVEGAKFVCVREDGRLQISGEHGAFVSGTPAAFRSRPGGTRESVDCAYRVFGSNAFGFVSDTGHGIAVAADGTAYVVGWTESTNFPVLATGGSPYSAPLLAGESGAFITAVRGDGTALVHSNVVRFAQFNDVALDAIPSSPPGVIAVGYAETPFQTTAGAFQTAASGGNDTLVFREDQGGTILSWATRLGGDGIESATGVGVHNGEAIVVGVTDSSPVPPCVVSQAFPITTTFGFLAAPTCYTAACFATRFDSAGTALQYSGVLAGSTQRVTVGMDFAVAGDGTAYVTGFTDDPAFPTTAGSYQQAKLSTRFDAFLCSISSGGSIVPGGYSTFVGDPNDTMNALVSFGIGVGVNSFGNAVLTGLTESTAYPVTDASSLGPLDDSVLTMLRSDGAGPLAYSTYHGAPQEPLLPEGNGREQGFDVVVSGYARVAYVVGVTTPPQFPVTPNAVQPTLGSAPVVAIEDYFVSAFLLPQVLPP